MIGSPRRLAFVDALRGYAILGVVCLHTGLISQAHLNPIGLKLAWSAQNGVQLFFVASAVTLMMSWHARKDGALPFFIRRFFRIAPMFWLAIPFYLWLNGASHDYVPGGISWWHVLLTASFLHGWHPENINTIVPGGWSIADEMTFYLLFPFLVFLLNNWRVTAVAIIISLIVSEIGKQFLLNVFDNIPSLPAMQYFWFFSQLPVFLIGMAAYQILNRVSVPKWAAWGCVIIALAAIFFVLPFHQVPTWLGSTSNGTGPSVYAAAFGVLVFGLANGADNVIVNKPIRFLGRISYSFYLLHFAAIYVARRVFTDPTFTTLFSGIMLITLPASWITYTVIEQPFIALGNRLLKRMAGANRIAKLAPKAVTP
jgi:peptidoglycan/LPS O-acetylase OafA/YrhL